MDKSHSKTYPNVKIGVVGGSKGIFNNWNQVLTKDCLHIKILDSFYITTLFLETVDLNNALEYQQLFPPLQQI